MCVNGVMIPGFTRPTVENKDRCCRKTTSISPGPNTDSPLDCGRLETAALIHRRFRTARHLAFRDCSHSRGSRGVGVNLHDNDLVPIDAACAERDSTVVFCKRLQLAGEPSP